MYKFKYGFILYFLLFCKYIFLFESQTLFNSKIIIVVIKCHENSPNNTINIVIMFIIFGIQ